MTAEGSGPAGGDRSGASAGGGGPRRGAAADGGRFRRAAGVLERRFGDEVLLAARGRRDVDRLAGTGAAVWELLDGPRTAAELAAALEAAYEAGPGSIERDVRALLEDLAARGYVEEVADG